MQNNSWHVWLLSRSSCSSPFAKELHVQPPAYPVWPNWATFEKSLRHILLQNHTKYWAAFSYFKKTLFLWKKLTPFGQIWCKIGLLLILASGHTDHILSKIDSTEFTNQWKISKSLVETFGFLNNLLVIVILWLPSLNVGTSLGFFAWRVFLNGPTSASLCRLFSAFSIK